MAFMAALLGAFIVLLFAVRGDETIDRDRIITRELQRFRSGPLDTLQRFLTIVGNFGTLLPLAIVGVIGYLRAGRKWAALLLALTLLGQPLNIAIKRIAERPRPSETLDGIAVLMPATDSSFPSGHSMGAVLFYGFLAYLAYVLIPDRRRRLMAVALLAPLPILIGVSRIYVGGHWFSDVIGGWIVGLFFLVGFAEAYRLLAGREVAPPATTTPAPIEP